MLICAMMTSISIVREKETGTMEVLLVSPVKPLFIILAKAVPLLCVVICQPDYDSAAFGLCPSCSGCRQPVLADCRITAFHFRIIGFGTAYLHSYPYTGGSYVGVRLDADDAHYVAFGNDISY